mgnify:CR=1 FL=1
MSISLDERRRLRQSRGRVLGLRLGVGLGLLVAACGPKELPTADEPQRAVPNLAGLSVMVLPAQPGPGGVPVGLDEALAANLADRSPGVNWVFPAQLERALTRAPWMQIRPRSLSVAQLRQPDVERIYDPLYGDLRRMGALVDARYAVLPYAAGYVQSTVPGEQGRVEVAAVIIDTVGGRVLWHGIVAGERGAAGDEVVIGTAAQAVAAMVAPAG